MFDILVITGPIYLCIAVGYVTTRFGVFARADRQVFGKFVIKIAVPALLCKTLAERPIGEIMNVGYLLAYLAGTFVVIGLGLFWCRLNRMDRTSSALAVMGMACSNSVFIGYPVILLTVPSAAALSMALNALLENIVVTPLMLVLAESGRVGSGDWYRVLGRSLRRLFFNPIIIGLGCGIAISLLGWKLPEPIGRTLGIFAMSTGGLSLFVIGSTLVGLPMRGMMRRVVPIVVGKLLFHPLAVFLSLLVLPVLGVPPLDPELRTAALLMAAVPMLAIYPIFAQIFGQEEMSAAALLMATAASFFTLSALLWALAAFSA